MGCTLERFAIAKHASAINSGKSERGFYMGSLCTIGVKDVNGKSSKTQFWTNDTVSALGAAQAVANLSNAQVVSCYLTKDVDISDLADNVAVAANIETVTEKAKIRLSGADALSAGALRLTATISIPAPLGTIINAVTGAVDGALVTPFIGVITTYNGLVTDRIDKVYYSKSR